VSHTDADLVENGVWRLVTTGYDAHLGGMCTVLEDRV